MREKDLIGMTICDSYIVDKLIGAGNMGAVFEVRHVRLPKRFAMKVLSSDLQEGSEAFLRFRREAEITSSLGHPNIVNVVDFNRLPDGAPFLIMELLSGETLQTRMMRVGPMSLPVVLELARQVGSALAAAHKQGVVHRDLKPQNIFLCKEDRGDEEVEVAKVLDFGISKILGDPGTQTGAMRVMGTPLYMAPEQAMGFAANVDARADQFALAAILYHLLSGRRPFDGQSVVEIALKVMNEAPAPLRSLRPDLSPQVERAIEEAMSKDREQRFASVQDFIRALGVVRFTSAIGFPAPPSPVEPPLLSRSERSAFKLGVVALLSGVICWGVTKAVGQAILPPPSVIAQQIPPTQDADKQAAQAKMGSAPATPIVVKAPAVPLVSLRFAVTPTHAEILLDGKRVDFKHDSEVKVPKSERGLRLEVRAPSFTPHIETVVPSSDQRIILHLAPAVPSRRRPSLQEPTKDPYRVESPF